MKRCFTLLLTLLLLAVPAGAVYAGIDVSVWQGEINFTEVKRDGKEIVYIRAGYGLREDTRFRENAANARKAGLNIGFYFFVTAKNTEEAREQARYFARLIETWEYECRPAVDFEQFQGLSKEETNRIALAFAETVQELTGVVPLFYTNVSSAREIWEEALTRYPLWIAEYGVSRPASLGLWRDYAGFQYNDTGKVSGISGNVDLNRFTAAVLREPSLPFVDVPAGAWFSGAVQELHAAGLLRGVTETRFLPYEDASRAQMTQLLYRAAGQPSVSGTPRFRDVPRNAWFTRSVLWAEQQGIARGYGEIFLPNRPLSRQEAVVFLYRFGENRGYDVTRRASLSRFSDGAAFAYWARNAAEWAAAEGILQGTPQNLLEPERETSRAELAVFLERFLTRYE